MPCIFIGLSFLQAEIGGIPSLHIFGQTVPFATAIALLAALGLALGFEFVQ